MNISFWITLILMTLGATGFLVLPALRHVNASDSRSQTPFLVVAVVVPILTIALYANIGSPRAAVADTGSRGAPAARTMTQAGATSTAQKPVAAVGSLVDGLAERLRQQPDDAGGWLLLAKSYRHLERRDDAQQAYDQAKALGTTDADLEDWLASANQIAAQQSTTSQTMASQSMANQPETTQGTEIKGRVSIAAGSAGIDGSATVFIVARAANGSPMPLAVLKTNVASLPYEFTITDANSMVASNKVSTADKVIIIAKVSANGDAMTTVPGLEAHSDPVSTFRPAYVELELGH